MTDNAVSERMGYTYQEVVRLIHKQVHRMVGNGVAYNKEQAVSDANLAFVQAFANYDSNRAQFNTYVGYRVLMRIKSEFRRLHKKPRPLTFSELDESGQNQIALKLSVNPESENIRPDWTDSLSKDAKEVVDLVFEFPREFKMLIDERGKDNVNAYKSSIREHLIGIGWSKKRISKVFDEIKEAIRV